MSNGAATRSWSEPRRGAVRRLALTTLVAAALFSGLVAGASFVWARAAAASDPGEPEVFRAADASALDAGQLSSLSLAYIETMGTKLEEMKTLYQDAKQDKDVVKTLCLDDKVNQLSTAVASSEDRRQALLEALENGAIDRARHEFTLIGVLAERSNTLSLEAGQCIGEESVFNEDEESTLELTIANILPNVSGDLVEIPPAIVVAPAVKSPVD